MSPILWAALLLCSNMLSVSWIHFHILEGGRGRNKRELLTDSILRWLLPQSKCNYTSYFHRLHEVLYWLVLIWEDDDYITNVHRLWSETIRHVLRGVFNTIRGKRARKSPKSWQWGSREVVTTGGPVPISPGALLRDIQRWRVSSQTSHLPAVPRSVHSHPPSPSGREAESLMCSLCFLWSLLGKYSSASTQAVCLKRIKYL